MQPSPIAETSGPSLPSRRRCVTIVIALPFACFALRDLRPGEIAGRRRSRHHPFRGRDFRPLRSGARRDPKIAWNYRGAATVSRERVLQQSSCTMSARVFAVALSTALAAAPALAHAQWHHGYPHGYYHGGATGPQSAPLSPAGSSGWGSAPRSHPIPTTTITRRRRRSITAIPTVPITRRRRPSITGIDAGYRRASLVEGRPT